MTDLFTWRTRRDLPPCPLWPGCGCGTQSGPHACEGRQPNDKPTKHQRLAIALATPSGYLRRLSGGYWVGQETPWRDNIGMLNVPEGSWVGTQTVEACCIRGWFERADLLARLTDKGRKA